MGKKLKIYKKQAKSISYGGKRNRKDIKYIVIHYTGNRGDTAKGNANYFATSNTRQAGAHFFISNNGEIWRSIPMNRIAWAVGGYISQKNGAGSYYGKCTNSNSVSIELCDCLENASWEQMLATRKLVKYIQKYCPNAKTIIRHWEVSGKPCPAPMAGKNNKKWKYFHNKVTKNYQFRGIVTDKAWLRTTPKVKDNNKIRQIKEGEVVKISKITRNWGRLLNKINGKYAWISLKKVSEL